MLVSLTRAGQSPAPAWQSPSVAMSCLFRADLRRLAQDLRGTGEVSAQGMARVRRLLTDGASPIYIDGPSSMLAHAVVAAVVCLGDEPHGPP